ncbi:MAG: hypothetical protein K2X93_23015 [Candidatus Obscuribacterales bacterium]|nr:hypothetical protein [Candidatus Obscuribacterales bacterium]
MPKGELSEMDLDDSKKELKSQMESQGYAVLDDKTIPAIQDIVGRAIERQKKDEEAAGPVPDYLEGIEVYEDLGGNCPVQGTGWFTSVDGKLFAYYFRARGTSWSVDIGDSELPLYPDNHDDPKSTIKWEIVGFYGETAYAAGWMPRAHAMYCLNSTYKAWLAAGGPEASGEFEMLPDFVTPVEIR